MTDTAALRRLLQDIIADAAQNADIGLVQGVTPPELGAVGIGFPAHVPVSLARLHELAALADLPLHDAVEVVWERGRAGLH